MDRCPSCGGEVRTLDRFCSDCGVPLESRSYGSGRRQAGPEVDDGPGGSPSALEAQVDSLGVDIPLTIVRAALSSEPTQRASFMPGRVLCHRYRVLSLVGRGGMGEVYRADDLKLGQPVALKFLSPGLERDPSRFRRFLNEVRLARRVGHPNVCRVYDVADFDGHHFLSMEYIDGEDLASLLRRIGRLPEDKAVQIGRQICLGLAAAHDQGILHRDLKPANIMIDGRGNVRLTDFGLAVLTNELESGDQRTGTPAYMAPEQFYGTEVTHKSDIFAVGLVLYELFTGKRPFESASTAGIAPHSDPVSPPSPATHVGGLDSAVEQIILRCLEIDPVNRPGSAVAVAKALPGADPLAEAIAGGETPPLELVANGQEPFAVRPFVAWANFALFVVMLLVAVAAGSFSRSLSHVASGKPQGYLLERSRQVVTLAGNPAPRVHEAFGYSVDREVSQASPGTTRPPMLVFWYRQAPTALVPSTMVVTPDDPPSSRPGMASVSMDTLGRLRRFESFPSTPRAGHGADPRSAWDALFDLAGLARSDFSPVTPESYPTGYADTRAAWTSAPPENEDQSIRVEAASLDGRPVSFNVTGPAVDRAQPPKHDIWSAINTVATFALFGPVLIGGLFLARHNLLQGRGDRKGAFRLATFMLGLWLVFGALGSDHFLDIAELRILFRALARACLSFAVFWVLYMALEPYARRYWPLMLVSWIRLLDGRVRDPLLGWHLLIGATVGVGATLIEHAGAMVTQRMGLPAWEPGSLSLQLRSLTSFRFALAGVLDLLDFTVTTSLQVVVILLVLRTLLRQPVPTAIGLYIVSLFVFAGSIATLPTHGLIIALLLLVLFRVGLLALMSGLFVFVLSGNYLISPSPSSPFAAVTYLSATIALAVAGYGLGCMLGIRRSVATS